MTQFGVAELCKACSIGWDGERWIPDIGYSITEPGKVNTKTCILYLSTRERGCNTSIVQYKTRVHWVEAGVRINSGLRRSEMTMDDNIHRNVFIFCFVFY